MGTDDDQAVVELQDDVVVTLETPGEVADPQVQKDDEQGEHGEPERKAAPQPEPKKPRERVRIRDPQPEDEASKKLQQTLENEQRLRKQAEQNAIAANARAMSAEQSNAKRASELKAAQEQADASRLASYDQGIANAESQIESAKREVASAMAEGKFEAVAEAQTKLGRATAALDRLSSQKEDFEAARASRAETVADEPAQVHVQQTQVPLIDQYTARMDSKSQQWLREHPDCAPSQFGGDDEKNAKMLRGHYDAISQGYRSNSPEYFRIIEESVGLRQPENQTEDEGEDEVETKPAKKPAASQPQRQRQANPSAPPSRSPPGSPPSGGNRTVRLSVAEQEAARFSFPHLDPQKAYAEYARNKVQLESEGKLGRHQPI